MKKSNKIKSCLVLMLLMLGTSAYTQTTKQEAEKCPYQIAQPVSFGHNPAVKAKEAIEKITKTVNDKQKILDAVFGVRNLTEIFEICEFCAAPSGLGCMYWEWTRVEWRFPVLYCYADEFRLHGFNVSEAVVKFPDHYAPLHKTLFEELPKVTEALNGLSNPSDTTNTHISKIIEDIGGLHSSLDAASKSLGKYNQDVTTHLDAFNTVYGEFSKKQTESSSRIHETGFRCGRETMLNMWKEKSDALGTELAEVMTKLTDYGVTKTKIDNEVSEILGPLTDLLDNFVSACCKLWEAKNATGVNKSIKITEAQTFWKDSVTEYITSEFGAG
ncbi:hypothetical protein [Roseivirga sp. E12]|uniref:hypothetical protein n=1 Tax=Roseivirga sp. E12 TaxID=2819237 RepID=UPI001ABC4B54|nr:hypothetical protein [Roseivirga sp. E12]MBO3698078.1 hypothetical protein [Roseivirga sp. E12]